MRWIGGLLYLLAALLLNAPFGPGSMAMLNLVGALAAVAGGTWVLTRGKSRKDVTVALPPEAEARLKRLEEELASTQTEVARLEEEREFLRQLYPGAAASEPSARE